MAAKRYPRDFHDNRTSHIGSAAVVQTDTVDGTADFTYLTNSIWVAADGDLTALLEDGTDGVYIGVKAGTLIPCCARLVKDTGTTVSNANLRAFY